MSNQFEDTFKKHKKLVLEHLNQKPVDEGILDFFKKKEEPKKDQRLQRNVVYKIIEKLISLIEESIKSYNEDIKPLEDKISAVERKLSNSSFGGRKKYNQGHGYYSDRPDQDYEYWTQDEDEPKGDKYNTEAEYDKANDWLYKAKDKLSDIKSAISTLKDAADYFSKKLNEMTDNHRHVMVGGGEISYDLYTELFNKYNNISRHLKTKDEAVDKFFH